MFRRLPRFASSFAKFQRTSKLIAPKFASNSFRAQIVTKRFYSEEEEKSSKNVAVIYSGCGYLDGTEITEAVSTLIHLSRRGAKVFHFAPEGNQDEVMDHANKTIEKNEERNYESEVTRLTRTKVNALSQLPVETMDYLVFPGGYGIGKNLSNYVAEGTNLKVNPEIESIIKAFHKKQKPMAFACIAPILAAKVLGTENDGPGISVTVGDADVDTISNIEKLGNTHVKTRVTEAHTDTKNLIVSTAAYMDRNPSPAQIYQGIGEMIRQLLAVSADSSDGLTQTDGLNPQIEQIITQDYGEGETQKLKKQLGLE